MMLTNGILDHRFENDASKLLRKSERSREVSSSGEKVGSNLPNEFARLSSQEKASVESGAEQCTGAPMQASGMPAAR